MIDIRYNNDDEIVIRAEDNYVIIHTYNVVYSKYYCVCAFLFDSRNNNSMNEYFQDILSRINIKSVIMPYDGNIHINALYIEQGELDKLKFLLKLNNGSMCYDY